MWRAKAKVNGVWVVRTECASRIMAKLSVAQDIAAGREVKLVKVW